MSRFVSWRGDLPVEVKPTDGPKFTYKELKQALGGPPVLVEMHDDKRNRCIIGNANSLGDDSATNPNASTYCGIPINGDFLVVELRHFDATVLPQPKLDGIRLLTVGEEIKPIPFDGIPRTPNQIEELIGTQYDLVAIFGEQDYLAGVGHFNRIASIELGQLVNGDLLAIHKMRWIAPKHIYDKRKGLERNDEE